MHTFDDFAHGQYRLGVVVDLCGGDDIQVTFCAGQVIGEIGEDLAGCRMVGEEKLTKINRGICARLYTGTGRDAYIRPLPLGRG